MDKVFNVEIDGQITLPDGRKLGPFEETTVNVVQPSEGSSDPILSNAKQTGGIGYTEQGEQVLFDGDLLIDQPSPAPESSSVLGFIDIDSLEVGKTYNIKWDGVDYTCECADMGGIAYIGNPSIIGAPIEGDEPFAFALQNGAVMAATLSAGTYSIKLSKNGDTIHQIDEKYLPASGGAMVVNMTYSQDGHRWTADKSISEICESYFSGRIIIAKTDDADGKFALTAVGAVASANGGWTVFFGINGGVNYNISVLKGVQYPDTDRWNYGVN